MVTRHAAPSMAATTFAPVPRMIASTEPKAKLTQRAGFQLRKATRVVRAHFVGPAAIDDTP
jgi:hypothetical protein